MFKIVYCFLLLNVVLASNFGSEQGDKNDDPDQIPVNKDAVEVKESDPREATWVFRQMIKKNNGTIEAPGFSFNVSSSLLNPLAILYKLFEDEFELAKGDKNDDPDQIPVNKDAVEVKESDPGDKNDDPDQIPVNKDAVEVKESDPREATWVFRQMIKKNNGTIEAPGFSFNVSSPLLNPLAILYKLFEDEFELAKD